MSGGEYNCIFTSELANQRAPKALFACVVCNEYIYPRWLGKLIDIDKE